MSEILAERFADKETYNLVFKFDFGYFFDRVIKIQEQKQIFWSDIKLWLWHKHNITISVEFSVEPEKCHTLFVYHEGDWINDDRLEKFDSPIEAEIEGIKKAINYLSNNKKK